MLLEKGAIYQNDIGWLTSKIASYFNFSEFGLIYNFITYPNVIEENSYKYKFYDTVDKKIKDRQIYSPFSHFKRNGFEFERLIGPNKDDTVSVSLFDSYKKIQITFTHKMNNINHYANIIFRDKSSLFIKDFRTSE